MKEVPVIMPVNSSGHIQGLKINSLPVPDSLRKTNLISILIVFGLSILTIAGWIFNINVLKSLVPQWMPMNILTACCFIFAAAALLIIRRYSELIIWKIIPGVMAIILCLISLITIYLHLYLIRMGHESGMVGKSILGYIFSSGTRLKLLASINFLLIGIIIILLIVRVSPKINIAHILNILVMAISYFVIISYILSIPRVTSLYEITMALNTCLAFGGLSLALLVIRPNSWLVSIFTESNTSGIITKRILPALVILPVLIGWIHLLGERSGFLNSEVGVATAALLYTIFLLIFTWRTSISIRKIEMKRQAFEEALQKSEKSLKELNATKDKFFSIVAHDLKNPFTSLLGSSEILMNNIDSMDPENIKKLSEILHTSAKNGYAILENLLDWSRSQTGTLEINPERTGLKNLLEKNISNLQLSANNKHIVIQLDPISDIFIFADKNMINTVLRNLISNAIKFTPKGGKVDVSAKVIEDEVIISVTDTGIGITKGRIDTLFRIDSRNSTPGTENEQGTGLGLKLSKEFVEKQGGRIWVESKEGIGSTFKFTIPYKAS